MLASYFEVNDLAGTEAENHPGEIKKYFPVNSESVKKVLRSNGCLLR